MAVCLPGRTPTPRVNLREARECSVAVIGPSGVGKSNFAAVFFGHAFDPLLEPSVVEFTLRSEMFVADEPFVVLVVDTPPHDYATPAGRCQGVIGMYDVCSRDSFEKLKEMIETINGGKKKPDAKGTAGGGAAAAARTKSQKKREPSLFSLGDEDDDDDNVFDDDGGAGYGGVERDEEDEDDRSGGRGNNSKVSSRNDKRASSTSSSSRDFNSSSGSNNEPPAAILICGHKCDAESARQVSADEGRRFASKCDALFVEASAKTRVNVEEAVYDVVNAIHQAGRAPRVEVTDEVPSGSRNFGGAGDPKCVLM